MTQNGSFDGWQDGLASNHIPNLLHVQEDGSSALCNMVGLLRFEDSSFESFSHTVAIELAIRHLNTGNSSLVPALSGLRETCPITFSASFAVTEGSTSLAYMLADWLTRGKESYNTDENETSVNLFNRPFPCAIIGSIRSSNSQVTSLMTGMRGFPQISPRSTSIALNNRNDYPLFGRTICDDKFVAESLIRFLHDELDVRHVFVIFDSDSFSGSFHESMRNAIIDFGWGAAEDMIGNNETIYMKSHLLGTNDLDPKEDGGYRNAVDALKESKYRFVVGLFVNRIDTDNIMKIAYEQNVAGNGEHQWWFSDAFSLAGRTFPKDSVLAKAYSGVGSVQGSPRADMDTYSTFREQHRELKEEMYGREVGNNDSTFLKGGEEHKFVMDVKLAESFSFTEFLNGDRGIDFSAFSYDATILLGLSACRETIESKGKDKESSLVLEGRDFYRRVVQTNFSGVTGDVVLKGQDESGTGSRDGHSLILTIQNWLALDDDDENNDVEFKPTVTHHYLPGGDKDWDAISAYVYNGGNTTTPPDLPPVNWEITYIGIWIQFLGFFLTAVILLLTAGFALWTFRHRKHRIVLASQPFFLLLICFGIAVMACTMIPTTMDLVKYDCPKKICTTEAWLLVMGFGITFSTLFAKTYRINKIMTSAMKFRRIKLTVRDTIYPVAFISGFNIVMLSLMTAYGSIEAIRVEENPDEFGRNTTMHMQCLYTDAWPYLSIIIIVNLVLVCMAIIQVWRARNLSTEFAESKYIVRALSFSLLALIFACPIIYIVQDHSYIHVFVVTGLIFAITTSTICYIFIPKVIFFMMEEKVMLGSEEFPKLFKSLGRPSEQPQQQGIGERILTAKTQAKLMSEIATLERNLASVTKQLESLELENEEMKDLLRISAYNSKDCDHGDRDVGPLRTDSNISFSLNQISLKPSHGGSSGTTTIFGKSFQSLRDSYVDRITALNEEDFSEYEDTENPFQ